MEKDELLKTAVDALRSEREALRLALDLLEEKTAYLRDQVDQMETAVNAKTNTPKKRRIEAGENRLRDRFGTDEL
jgi:chaperonin cofactor prefoldin